MWKTTVRSSGLVAGVFEASQQARRVANVNPRLGNVLGNNRAGANDGVIADRDWKNGGICSNAYTIPKSCCSPKVRLSSRAPGNERIIDKHGAMRNEAFVSDRYELTDECVRLNPASLADLYALLYFYEWTNEAAVSNRTPIEIDRLYDSDLFTKLNIDNSCVTDLWLCRKGLA